MKIVAFLLSFILALAVFAWSNLTNETQVRLTAAHGTLSLQLDGKQVSNCLIKPYETAELGIMLRQYRQAGESFFQGWSTIALRDTSTGKTVFSDRFEVDPSENWHPLKGRWGMDIWGHYALRESETDYLGYGVSELRGIQLRDFVFEGTVCNLSAAGLRLITKSGEKFSVHIIITPGPVVNWFQNGKSIAMTYGVDLSNASLRQFNLWPSKRKIVKNLLLKISGTVLAAQFLVLLLAIPVITYRFCSSVARAIARWSKGDESDG